MERNYIFRSTIFSFLKFIVFMLVLLINIYPETSAQIVFVRDTTLTGEHTFDQSVMTLDSTVDVTIQNANIIFTGGMTIEGGTLRVRASQLDFNNGSGLTVKHDGELVASLSSLFRGVTAPASIVLLNSKADIFGCEFNYVRIHFSGRPWWIPNDTWAFRIENCEIRLSADDPDPMFRGNAFEIRDCYLWREGSTVGQYYNISMLGHYGKVENCNIFGGGIESGWEDNRNLEIINNTIDGTKVGIYCLGVSKIEYNIIKNVEIGIKGGVGGTRLNNVLIENNSILNVSEQAIIVRGDSLTIHKNTITGNGETGKGILFDYSSGSITNNLISDFKISEGLFSNEGTALHLYNPQPGGFRTVEVSGNIFEYCGLSDLADPEIVSSIVHLESPVIFTGNEIRLNTLGGEAGSLTNFPGGPILDIVIKDDMDAPFIVNYNFIHSNIFVNDGTYAPTGTKGTLVAVELNNRRLEFRSNILYGTPDATLGTALFLWSFPGGVTGDSLIFDQNTFMNNLVGVGTIAAPDLSNENNFKDNTNYHIMRYGAYRDPEMFAQNNNWDSGDPAVIDNMLYDDDEESSTGPINFTGFYNVTYNIIPVNPGTQQLNQGDSLEIIIRVTDPQGNPISNMPGFFTSSNADVARVEMEEPRTDNSGYISGMLYACEDGSSDIRVFAGGSASAPIQVNVGATAIDINDFEVLNDFHLYQNYPNPFNPSTSIQYAIGSRRFVTLKVFDVLGREILTLVNEEKPAGNYEVELIATSLPSGVYFYKLKAGIFVQTKKMILLK